jgi:hypothetical protein
VVIKRSGHLHKGQQVVFDISHIAPGVVDVFNQFKPVKNASGQGFHYVKIKAFKIRAFSGGNIHYGIKLDFRGMGKTIVVLTDQNGLRRTFVLIYLVH